jgi:hypothetical protein
MAGWCKGWGSEDGFGHGVVSRGRGQWLRVHRGGRSASTRALTAGILASGGLGPGGLAEGAEEETYSGFGAEGRGLLGEALSAGCCAQDLVEARR